MQSAKDRPAKVTVRLQGLVKHKGYTSMRRKVFRFYEPNNLFLKPLKGKAVPEEKSTWYNMLPYRTRNLCPKGHRTASGKHEATIGVLHFIFEENGHLVNKQTDKPVRKKAIRNNLPENAMKQTVCMSRLLTLICMSWKKIKRVCRINWKSPLEMDAYICKINQYKSSDTVETGFDSYSMLKSFKWQENHDTSDIVKYRGFFVCVLSGGKVMLYQFSLPKGKMHV